jgi:predicted esterase YcpF (UPF0227 family)
MTQSSCRPVLYVHGYGSSGNTDTAVNLRRLLGEGFELVSPTYDGSRPQEAAQLLEQALAALAARHPGAKPVVVGTSLGGFFANYLAVTAGVDAVIVNPALRPSTSLHKYGEGADVLAGYQALERRIEAAPHRPERIVVVGTRDDVVDPHANGLQMKDVSSTVLLDMGHRIEPAFYDTIAGLARQLAGA